jgi:biotin carboxylase
MTRYLVVGSGSDLQPRLRRAAPDVQTVVLCRASALELVFGVPENEAVIVLGDHLPVDRWVSAARHIDEEWGVDAVVSFSEIDQDKAAHVAAALGLRCHSVETVARVHDKALMRARLAEVGLERVPCRTVRSLADLEAFYDAVGGPLIIKPTSGRASVGISLARTRLDLAEAYEHTRDARAPRLDPSPPLAERYIEGHEYSVEALTHHGLHHVFAVTEKFTDPASKVELGHVVPARLPRDDEQRVIAHVRAALTALGVAFGITHTEVILSADGPFIVETHLRGAGDEIIPLVHDATGEDMLDLFLRQIVGVDIGALPALRSRRDRPHYQASGAIRYLATEARGTLCGIDGWTEVSALPGVRDARQLVAAGAALDGLRSSRSRLGYVRVRADDADSAVALADAALGKLRIDQMPT